MKIWKFNLDVEAQQVVNTPEYFVPLSVQVQDGKIVLWAAVGGFGGDMTLRYHRTIAMCGTGHDVPKDMVPGRDFIGTVQHEGYVWHFWCRSPYAKDDKIG